MMTQIIFLQHKKGIGFSLLGMVVMITIIFNSCYYDNEEFLYGTGSPCDSTVYTYTGKVSSIISANCFSGCHEQATGINGIILEGYVNAVNYSITDNAGANPMLCSIKHMSGCTAMPKDRAKLTDCDIAIIQKWIESGHPES